METVFMFIVSTRLIFLAIRYIVDNSPWSGGEDSDETDRRLQPMSEKYFQSERKKLQEEVAWLLDCNDKVSIDNDRLKEEVAQHQKEKLDTRELYKDLFASYVTLSAQRDRLAAENAGHRKTLADIQLLISPEVETLELVDGDEPTKVA